ncbi:QWRF motif-containing protein 3-like [Dioscorea cayenensis subsp. rotundata]|uniref:QWRF motif-containing protein 3-like n=1 Tax=Dioscorea cayennensis subsp. rotundata TaxID=55577 RepID=A0AB40CRQ9_DIOCR|nr:QWRF motif-containing protein 3-like [Dioscorea cayenensis subsp. rotundata]
MTTPTHPPAAFGPPHPLSAAALALSLTTSAMIVSLTSPIVDLPHPPLLPSPPFPSLASVAVPSSEAWMLKKIRATELLIRENMMIAWMTAARLRRKISRRTIGPWVAPCATSVTSSSFPGRLSSIPLPLRLASLWTRTPWPPAAARATFLLDIPSFESDRSDNVSSNKIPNRRAPRSKRNDHQNEDKNHESKSVEMNPTMKPAPRRTSSGSAWALSPGRRASSPPLVDGSARPAAAGLRSFSNLRPPSPGRGKGGGGGVGNILSLGLDLFRKKSGSPTLTPSSSFGNGSPKMAAGEAGHQFKIVYNRLMQWRFANARSDASSRTKADTAQTVMTCAWAGLAKLQVSVAQKQLQLQKEKLLLKINTMLSCQVKLLDRWNDTERQYVAALSTTRDSLQSVVSRLPIVEGAKADPQHISAAFRQANDLTSTIKTTVGIFSPMNLEMVPLLSELAQVTTEEKSLLEEASELLGLIFSLQLQEESLKCHLIQLNSGLSTEHVLPARNAIATA